jgi:glycyl-tRNA synthetase
MTFQEIIRNLSAFWEKNGCIVHQGYDVECGAGTFNPATFLRCLGKEPYRAAYVEPCRRPSDGRYGENPNRLQHYFQYQVIIKPSPSNIQQLYLESLEAIGLDLKAHDIRFVHDDWENPTIGAWGLGWEVWCDGMEVTQFTYFQSVGGVPLKPITAEITYGIERLAMYIQGVESIFDIKWNDQLTYGDIYHRQEVEWSGYNFEEADTKMWLTHFEAFEREAKRLMEKKLPLPAYDFIMKASHAFNILDARGVISVTERTGYIGRIRALSRQIAESYEKSREDLAYPLLGKFQGAPEPLMKKYSLSDSLMATSSKERGSFLLELGSEELPATFVPIGMRELKKHFELFLKEEGLSYEGIEVFGTPRRLSLLVKGLVFGKEAVFHEKRGPAVSLSFDPSGAPLPAALGFFKSVQLPPYTLSQIEAGQEGIKIERGYLVAHVKEEAFSSLKRLSERLPSLISALEFPKSMRWGSLDFTYPRPLRWIVALFGETVVPFEVAGVFSGKESFGHRQLDLKKIEITSGETYVEQLKAHKVMVDPKERQEAIEEQLKKIEGVVLAKERVIPQVLHLVEWPMLTLGSFDQSFLRVPKEVLISEMVEHQKYFPVADREGNLKNQFVITADNTPSEKIRAGNQRVLSARLSDGVFLFEQDKKQKLSSFNEKLKSTTYQKEWGSVFDKVERIKKNGLILQEMLKIGSKELVERGASLCKADLASQMVYEFPELQGVMGRYYAELEGEDPEVAKSIEEHWCPRFEGDRLPQTKTGVILALADKSDNLICCFASGLKPTSSSDPYALRRQVFGIIKMLIDNEGAISLPYFFETALNHYKISGDKKLLIQEMMEFITSRVKSVFQEFGFQKDEIESSLSLGVKDIFDAFLRVKALHEFRKEEAFTKLLEVFKRARGQIKGVDKGFSKELLKEKAEKELASTLDQVGQDLEVAIAQKNYGLAYREISKLQPKVAALFDEVRILTEDEALRENRIGLLEGVFALFGRLIDFNKLLK